MVDLLIPLLKAHWYEVVTTLVAAFGVGKYVVLKSVIGRFSDYVKEVQESKADGVVSDAEYAKIGKKAVAISDMLVGYVSGLFPNRSAT